MKALYENPLSITSQFSFCGLPFRLDTYAGCGFSCTYCFSRLRGGNISPKKIRPVNANAIVTRIKNAIERPSWTNGLVSELIRRRMPLHFGGMSDGFQPAEKKYRVSLQTLKYLCSITYPVVISTRSTLLASEPYLSLLRSNPYIVVQYSFSSSRDDLAGITEPYSEAPSNLLKSMERVAAAGVKISARWQPYIPDVSEAPAEFIGRVCATGIRHISFEHLKLPYEQNNILWRRLKMNLDFDIVESYRKAGCRLDGRELVLCPTAKRERILEVKKIATGFSITFGAADNEFQYLSGTDCCCSGVDQFEGFENWNKFQIGYAVRRSPVDRITLSSVAREWRPTGAIDKHLNSNSRLVKRGNHNGMGDYILDRWENLSSPFNPMMFYGIVDTGQRDAEGNRIYRRSESCST
jgi:DNA repair photolyase